MCKLSDYSGSYGHSETSWEDGNSATFTKNPKSLISRANTVSMYSIFKHYKLNINAHNNRIICPFKSHRGGNENTASFNFYPDTNSYHCFGCKVGYSACDFVAEMDRINKNKAAEKILSLFDDSLIEESSSVDLSERLNIMMDFSNFIRDFREIHTSIADFKFIEGICSIYDQMYNKYNTKHRSIENEALLRISNTLKEKAAIYANNNSG